MDRLDGKVAIVTGAARGQGAATAARACLYLSLRKSLYPSPKPLTCRLQNGSAVTTFTWSTPYRAWQRIWTRGRHRQQSSDSFFSCKGFWIAS